MTPAEKLAAAKPWVLRGRKGKAATRNRLRELREAARLSLRDVANAVGLTYQTLHAIEHGTVDPRLTLARKLAAFFGVDVAEIWKDK